MTGTLMDAQSCDWWMSSKTLQDIRALEELVGLTVEKDSPSMDDVVVPTSRQPSNTSSRRQLLEQIEELLEKLKMTSVEQQQLIMPPRPATPPMKDTFRSSCLTPPQSYHYQSSPMSLSPQTTATEDMSMDMSVLPQFEDKNTLLGTDSEGSSAASRDLWNVGHLVKLMWNQWEERCQELQRTLAIAEAETKNLQEQLQRERQEKDDEIERLKKALLVAKEGVSSSSSSSVVEHVDHNRRDEKVNKKESKRFVQDGKSHGKTMMEASYKQQRQFRTFYYKYNNTLLIMS